MAAKRRRVGYVHSHLNDEKGNDTLIGGFGRENVNGGTGNDSLFGGSNLNLADSVLDAGDGAHQITACGTGASTLTGGNDANRFVFG
ncbi:hypothetical protein J5Y09_09700 [Roseomonas sp. PWR1]|uniref:Calcium-binding protein n=1 Tax=Roseomonas nitratireducens TaxID=2820810 RepID=A0ABS4AS51_9PROT|nr:hypothetical protein [Neoroseomonas nitratireducens]MBP0464185.1 hypothetical protein [Neoroseomonas nitratireducens]